MTESKVIELHDEIILDEFNKELLEDLTRIEFNQLKNGAVLAALLTVITASEKSDPCYAAYEKAYEKFREFECKEGTAGEFPRPVFRDQPQQNAMHQQQYVGKRWSLSTNTVVDVPETYSEGFVAASLYLLLKDVSVAFEARANGNNNIRAIEIPCLLEMVIHSNKNDIKESIFGEYVALADVSCHPDFRGWYYRRETETFDFRMYEQNDMREGIGISVKSVNFSTRKYFHCSEKQAKRIQNLSIKPINLVSGDNGFNILVHNCTCNTCIQNPVQKVKKESSGTLTGLNGECADKFKVILENLNFGIVYLVHADLYFELRFATCTFDQTKFRGRRFERDKVLFKCLLPNCAEHRGVPRRADDDGNVRIPTLIDRS